MVSCARVHAQVKVLGPTAAGFWAIASSDVGHASFASTAGVSWVETSFPWARASFASTAGVCRAKASFLWDIASSPSSSAGGLSTNPTDTRTVVQWAYTAETCSSTRPTDKSTSRSVEVQVTTSLNVSTIDRAGDGVVSSMQAQPNTTLSVLNIDQHHALAVHDG
eukprot:3461601-Amphidinium_carterae.1